MMKVKCFYVGTAPNLKTNIHSNSSEPSHIAITWDCHKHLFTYMLLGLVLFVFELSNLTS